MNEEPEGLDEVPTIDLSIRSSTKKRGRPKHSEQQSECKRQKMIKNKKNEEEARDAYERILGLLKERNPDGSKVWSINKAVFECNLPSATFYRYQKQHEKNNALPNYSKQIFSLMEEGSVFFYNYFKLF